MHVLYNNDEKSSAGNIEVVTSLKWWQRVHVDRFFIQDINLSRELNLEFYTLGTVICDHRVKKMGHSAALPYLRDR